MPSAVHWIEVAIPTRALGAADWDGKQPVPEPLPEGTDLAEHDAPQRMIGCFVPENSQPGCILQIPVGADESLNIGLPPLATGGDEIYVVQRRDGSWRAMKKTLKHSFLLPDAFPGEELAVPLPDGRELRVSMPGNAKAGQILTCELQNSVWAMKSISLLPEAVPESSTPAEIQGPYTQALCTLRERGCLSKLPVDKDGILHVSLPFCGSFSEHTVLGNFLADECLCLPQVASINVLGSEVSDGYSFYWAMADRWFRQIQPKIGLRMTVRDLAVDGLPQAGLVLAIHPEVTKGGYWFPIIGSIVRTCRGVCLFATFYEAEMQTLLNMIDMFKDPGTTVEVVNNAYYDTVDSDQPEPLMRYLILVFKAGLETHN